MQEHINKPERLASAIYLITSFFGDQEPLKWTLRTLASELITLAVSLNDKMVKEREVLVTDTRNNLLKAIKFFTVAKNAGLISSDNYELMREELNKYIGIIDQPINISDFFTIESAKLKIKEQEKVLMIKDKSEDKDNEAKKVDKSLTSFGAVSVKKNGRQSIIIGLLKRKKEIMIKDVSPLINGCSEKTIQRELSAMVQNGVLKRIGEKRWSKYLLA